MTTTSRQSLVSRIAVVGLTVLATGVLPVMLAGCPGPEYPKCEKDDQCKKAKDGSDINEYCLFGQCQECAKDTHCDAGETCNKGRCEKSCAGDGECGAGNICENAVCVTAECTPERNCGGGMSCDAGRCKAPTQSTVTPQVPGSEDLKCEQKVRVAFDFNTSDLRPEARASLDNFAKCMQKNAAWSLTIEGHADERGTTDYNLALGERRAESIREYITRLGVDKARTKVISYGEERPLNPAATEEAWAQNRRGELIAN